VPLDGIQPHRLQCFNRSAEANGARQIPYSTRFAVMRGSVFVLNRLNESFCKVTRDITEQKHTERRMAILADASRLLAESLDSDQILFTITRMAVPNFATVFGLIPYRWLSAWSEAVDRCIAARTA